MLWKPVYFGEKKFKKLKDAEYSNVELNHMLADNCAMQLVKKSKTIRCNCHG